jgi:hypothetical protein
MAQAAEGFAFDLSDPFASETEFIPNFFKRIVVSVFKTKTQA